MHEARQKCGERARRKPLVDLVLRGVKEPSVGHEPLPRSIHSAAGNGLSKDRRRKPRESSSSSTNHVLKYQPLYTTQQLKNLGPTPI